MNVERGRAYAIESENVAVGAIVIVLINAIADGEITIDDLETKFENNGSLAEDLFTEPIINGELAKGKNVGIITHPDTHVIFSSQSDSPNDEEY